MSITKRIAVTLVSVLALVGLAGACTPPEQYAFFVHLGERSERHHEVSTLEDAAALLHEERTAWTPEVATPEQNAVLVELGRQSGENARRRQIQGHPFLTCVRNHESATSGLYSAINQQGSSASGAYQFLDSTWRVVAPQAGYSGYARAVHAPWYVQDAVALWLYNNGGKSAWAGTGC